MRSVYHFVITALLMGFLPQILFAQEKTQSYYNSHENEILPDANISFQRGDYEHAVELCKWHYIIVGNHSADILKNKAERCASLTKEMESLQFAGKTKEARDIAKTILSINPSDSLAKEVSQSPDLPKSEAPLLTKDIPTLISQPPTDIAVNAKPEVSLVLPSKEETVAYDSMKATPVGEKVKQETFKPESQKWPYSSNGIVNLHNTFVVKVGISLYNYEEKSGVYPSISMGLYNIRGSRSGIEMGVDIWDRKNQVFYSASYVFRGSRFFYPKVDLGFITYNGEYEEPFIGLGSSFFLGKIFCLEIRTIYQPAEESFTPSFKVGMAF